jgi:hypothetical protein
MEIFERIRRRDDELHQILVEFFPWTMPILDLAAAPRKTLQVFLLSMAKIDFLKSGIFDLCESDNPYAAKVLYRSLVEHHAQFMYVWHRYLKAHNDEAAEEYLTFYAWDEYLKYGKDLKELGARTGCSSTETPYEVLCQVIPAVAAHSPKEIRMKARQFAFSEIVRFLREQWKSNKSSGGSIPDVVLKLPLLYGELCSFVHGGPDAEHELMSMKDEAERMEESVRLAQLSWQMSGSIKLLLLLVLYQFDKKFGPPFNKVNSILKSGI